MAHAHDIREGMQVIGSDGGMVGRVLGLHGDHIHIEPTAPVHGGDHTVPRSWVDHVDDHVHLSREAALVRDTWGSGEGHERSGPAATHGAAHRGKNKSWIVWLIGAILLLIIIVLGIRGFGYAADDSDMEQPAVDAPDS